MTQREKMLAGALYNAADPELTALRLAARRLTARYNATEPQEDGLRARILGELLGSAGKNTAIEPSFRCDYGFNIHLGDNFYMNFDCVLLDVCEIRFGDDCMVGPQVGIYTAGHPVDPVRRTALLEFGKPITVGHRCWIGGGAILCPGVTLGDNVVVAAGAVVTKSFGDSVVVGGNPARIIREV